MHYFLILFTEENIILVLFWFRGKSIDKNSQKQIQQYKIPKEDPRYQVPTRQDRVHIASHRYIEHVLPVLHCHDLKHGQKGLEKVWVVVPGKIIFKNDEFSLVDL